MRFASSENEVVKKCLEIEAGIKFVINDVQTIVKSNYGYIHCLEAELENVLAALVKMPQNTNVCTLSDQSNGLTLLKASCDDGLNENIISRSGLPAMVYNRVFYVLRDNIMESNIYNYTARAKFCWFVTNFNTIYSYASELAATSPHQILSVVCNFGSGHKIIPFTELRGIVSSDFINAQKLCSLDAQVAKKSEHSIINRKTCKNCLVEFASEIKMKAHYKDCTTVAQKNTEPTITKFPTFALGWNCRSEFDNITLLNTYGPRYELARNFSYMWRNTHYRDVKFYNIQCYTYSEPIKFSPNCHNCKTPLYDDCYVKLGSDARGFCPLCIHHFPRVGGSEKIIRTKVSVSVHDVIDRIPIVSKRNHKKYLLILHMLFNNPRIHGKYLIDDTTGTVLYTDTLQSLLSTVSSLTFIPTEIYSIFSF